MIVVLKVNNSCLSPTHLIDKNKVIEEITSAGFVQIDDRPLLHANYFLEFRKLE